jgi:hypothetical protein
MTRCMWHARSSITDSLFKQPAPASRQAPSPVLFVAAPVRPVVPIPSQRARGVEHREAQPLNLRAGTARRASGVRRTRPAALHKAAFLSPAPHFGWGGPQGPFGPATGAASAARRRPIAQPTEGQPVLVPTGDWPGPPDPAVTSRSGGRRHPAPPSERLMMTPLDEQDARTIRPPDRPGISFLWEAFSRSLPGLARQSRLGKHRVMRGPSPRMTPSLLCARAQSIRPPENRRPGTVRK